MTAAGPGRGRLGSALHEGRRRWARRRVAHARSIGSRRSLLALLATLVLLFGGVVWSFQYLSPSAHGRQVSLDELSRLTRARQVSVAEFLDEDARIRGTTRAATDRQFWVAYPKNDSTTAELIADLTAAGARVTVDPQSTKAGVRVVLTVLLPLMILANLFALFFSVGRGGASPLGEVVSFGQITRRRLGKRPARAVTFADVAALDEEIVELREVVDYLRQPERYEEVGAAAPRGVVLFGPPGCGKTLLAKAVAGEAEVPFFSVAGAEFVESLVGVGAARVRDLFARVRAVAPAIVFIDELDAAGRRRGSGASGGSEERDQTLNQLLVEMDGFDAASGIVVMAATNRPDIIDPALLRPGRFDRHITVERPDIDGRQAILALHASTRPLSPEVDLAWLARTTAGFSGADLANVVNEAALLTIRGHQTTITPTHLSEAVQRVLNGPQRSHLLSDDERRRVATHEAGHAVVGAATGMEVQRVSILARGRGLGGVRGDRSETNGAVATRSALLGRLVTGLAGVAAEELLLGEPSTGADDDLEMATALSRDIVARHGMTSALGRVRALSPDAEADLHSSDGLGPIAPETRARVDAEIRRLIDGAFTDATTLLRTHRRQLDTLVTRLLEEETLEGDALAALLPPAGEGEGATPRRATGARSSGRGGTLPSGSGARRSPSPSPRPRRRP